MYCPDWIFGVSLWTKSHQLTSLLQLWQPQTIRKPKPKHANFMGKRSPIQHVQPKLVNHLKKIFQIVFSKTSTPCQLQVGSFCFEMPPKALGFSRLPQPWKAAVHRMLSGCLVHKECSNRWMNHTHTNKMGKWRCLIPVKLQVTRSHSPCVPSIVAFLIMTSHLGCPCNLAD